MDFIKTYKAFDKEYCEEVVKNFEINSEMGCTNVRREGFRQDSNQELNTTFALSRLGSTEIADFRNSELAEEFFPVLSTCVGKYMEELGLQKTLSPLTFRNMIVQRTVAEQFEQYSQYHCEAENLSTADRALVYMLYLNDNFEGGETEFMYQKLRVVPEQGTLVIWPSGYTHTHRGGLLISGSKYIANGWAFFTDVKQPQ